MPGTHLPDIGTHLPDIAELDILLWIVSLGHLRLWPGLSWGPVGDANGPHHPRLVQRQLVNLPLNDDDGVGIGSAVVTV